MLGLERWMAPLLALAVGCTTSEPAEPAPTEPSPTAPQPLAEVTPDEPTPPPEPEPEPKPRPTDPAWHDVKIGKGCSLRMAQAPTALAMPTQWQPCADGSRGCRELTSDVPEDPLGGYILHGFASPAGVTTLARFSLPGPLTRVLASPLDGDPFLAIELTEGEPCELGSIDFGEREGIVEVAYDGKNGYASRAYLQGPLEPSPQWGTVAARLLRRQFRGFVGESVASIEGRVFVLANGGPLRWFDPAGDRWHEVVNRHSGWGCCLKTAGPVLAMMRESIPEVVVGSNRGADAVPLLQPAPGGGVGDIALDGDQAVWVQGWGRDNNNAYQRIELWAGRLEPTPAIVDRRRVMTLSGTYTSSPMIGGGMALVWPHDGRGLGLPLLVRLRDGAQASLPPMELRQVLWLDAHEMAVELGPPGAFIGPRTYRRLKISEAPFGFEAAR